MDNYFCSKLTYFGLVVMLGNISAGTKEQYFMYIEIEYIANKLMFDRLLGTSIV